MMGEQPPGTVRVPKVVERVLRGTVLYRTDDTSRVMKSPWMYRPCEIKGRPVKGVWDLSLLGALHTLTGLTIWIPDSTKEQQ